MTRLKDNPMDESAHPTPRPDPAKAPEAKKKKDFEKKEEGRVLDKRDPDAFDAKNNNMHKKR